MFKILYSFISMIKSKSLISRIFLAFLLSSALLLSIHSVKAVFDPAWVKVEAKYSQLTGEATKILMQKCKDCHTANTEYPFYSQFPLVKDLINADIRKGRAYFNMDNEIFLKRFDTDISTSSLNRLKTVLEEGSMPPMQYKMIHWDSNFSKTDKDIVLKWIADLSESDFLSIPSKESLGLNPDKVKLGELLYHDKRLSRDNSISCASCHDLAKGGTDQSQFSMGINNTPGHINSPTVYNSSYNIKQFWDGRAEDLVAQAHGPVHNPAEMGSNWDEVIAKLKNENEYKFLFKKVYGSHEMSGEKMAEAIATFEEFLITPGSKFDDYLKGNKMALSKVEKEGFGLFKKYNCNNCHNGVAIGGNSFQKMGIYKDYFADRATGENGLDVFPIAKEDLGRYNVTKSEADKHVFKVPTLRNIKDTFPYLHDGTVTELAQAVKIMAEYQVGKEIPEADVEKIVSFLKTL